MAKILTPTLAKKRDTKILKQRTLSSPGKILFKVGDQVKADNIVGKAEIQGDLLIERVSEELSITPEEVVNGIKVEIGDKIKHGDVLCEVKGFFGLFTSRYNAKHDGILEIINESTGSLGIRLASKHITLNSYISGRVVELVEDHSVTIETNGLYIQGIFGVGGERIGVIKCLEVKTMDTVNEKDIPEDCSNLILVGGSSFESPAIKKAVRLGAVGIITGSINDQTLKEYLGYDLGIALTGSENIQATLIILEGFGQMKLASESWRLFKEFDGYSASINGATQVRAGALRPEIIVQHDLKDVENFISGEDSDLKVGSKIRVIRVPYFGELMTVREIPEESKKLETGAQARVVFAERISDGNETEQEIVAIPRANIELIK